MTEEERPSHVIRMKLVLTSFENVIDSLGWDAIGGKENNDLNEWYIWLKELVE